MSRLHLPLTLALLAGCYNPTPEDGLLLCSTDKKCPTGYQCAANDHCYRDGVTPPANTKVADKCGGDLPDHLSSVDPFDVDTTGFTDDFSQLSGCTKENQPGNDAFFAIDMAAAERWHFHVRVPAMNPMNFDPSVYVLPMGCDDRACKPNASQDECGVGRDEHLTYIAPAAGRYIVVVDSKLSPGGGVWGVFALHPVCGNNKKEHSESCDDNNTNSGDGCSSACSTELRDKGMESEPNDDAIGSNPILYQPGPTGTATVGGNLRHGCDFDMFSLAVPAGGSIEAALLDGNGAACADTNKLQLELIGVDQQSVRGAGMAGAAAGNTCPAITGDPMFTFARSLGAGTYYLKVSQITRSSGETINYQLRAEVKP